VQPWGKAAIKAPLAMPRNASTQRGYSGINVLILWGEQQMEHELAMTRGSPLQSSKGLEK